MTTRIDYELAKELKDAGFPQTVRTGTQIYDYKGENLITIGDGDCWSPECECPNEDTVRNDLLANNPGKFTSYGPISPTLEELIEACGDCLSHIKKYNGNWWAVSHCGHEEHEPGGNNLEEAAPIPAEAVARLWLALNRKV